MYIYILYSYTYIHAVNTASDFRKNNAAAVVKNIRVCTACVCAVVEKKFIEMRVNAGIPFPFEICQRRRHLKIIKL